MKTYDVSALVKLEINARFQVQAKDEAEAEKKAQDVADSIVIDWTNTKPIAKRTTLELDETNQESEIESVEEA